MILGIDLGNKSRNAMALVDSTLEVKEYNSITYNEKETTPWAHRKLICDQIRNYIKKYHLTKQDWIIFEQVSMFMHGYNSKLTNIMSLAFIQATIINDFSNKISIASVPVVSWKAKVLNNRGATKEDAIEYVEKNYPKINLDIIIEHKRKEPELIKNHDLADSICIGVFGNQTDIKKLQQYQVNYT